jgi:hypothetical protein
MSRKNARMIDDAQFRVPDSLKVRSGSPTGKTVEIAYEVSEFDSDDYQFKCSYVSNGTAYQMVLSNCVDYNGYDLGDISNERFVLYMNDIIQMRFTGAPSSDLVVEAVYSMKWI